MFASTLMSPSIGEQSIVVSGGMCCCSMSRDKMIGQERFLTAGFTCAWKGTLVPDSLVP